MASSTNQYDLEPFEDWFPTFLARSTEWQEGQLSKNQNPLGQSRVEYFGRYCQICRRSPICGTPLSSCSGCSRVYYCCQEHQRLDWKDHKTLCKLFPPINTKPLNNIGEWRDKLTDDFNSILRSSAAKGRPIPASKAQLYRHKFFYSPHCLSCYVQNDLTTCPKCHVVMRCQTSKCVAKFNTEHTKEACENHITRLASVIMVIRNSTFLKTSSNSRCSFKLPESWGGYFALKKDDFDSPGGMFALPAVRFQFTLTMGGIFTLIHTLQKIYDLEDLKLENDKTNEVEKSDRSTILFILLVQRS